MRNANNPREAPKEVVVNESFDIPVGTVWTLTNEASQPIVLTFKIGKSI